MTNIEDCKGCRSYFEGIPDSCSVRRPLTKDCPCAKCIIKGICSISCDEFEIARDLVPLEGNRS